jgi:hypothetical protein
MLHRKSGMAGKSFAGQLQVCELRGEPILPKYQRPAGDEDSPLSLRRVQALRWWPLPAPIQRRPW